MTAEATTPIRRSKLYEQVLARMVNDILAGRHPPGSLLPSEDELRQRFGVGRLAVREALLALERLGITAFVPGVGIQVQVPTPNQIVDTLDLGVLHYLSHTEGSHTDLREVRRAIETDLARLAAERATEADIETMAAALAAGEAAVDDRPRYLVADRDFHIAVAAAARNAIFASLQRAVRRWIESYPSTRVHVPGSDARSHSDHLAVFNAIKARDPEAAAQAMAAHLAVDYSLQGKLIRLVGAKS